MALEPSGPTDAHRFVLELLTSVPEVPMKDRFELSPVCIARNTGYRDHDHVSKVCRELESAGLVRQTDATGTYYIVTWRGQAYLAGELELEPDDDPE
jgi:DNA-binding IclR family transcriptional regulator